MTVSTESAALCAQVAAHLDARIHGVSYSQTEAVYLAMMRAFRDMFQILADVFEEHGV